MTPISRYEIYGSGLAMDLRVTFPVGNPGNGQELSRSFTDYLGKQTRQHYVATHEQRNNMHDGIDETFHEYEILLKAAPVARMMGLTEQGSQAEADLVTLSFTLFPQFGETAVLRSTLDGFREQEFEVVRN